MATPKSLIALLWITTLSLRIFAGDCHPLAGEFRIGTDGDYATIRSAITALRCGGVNGPVVFQIAEGKYSEKIEIPAISGASGQNTITFQSEGGVSRAVVISSTSADAACTVRLNDASFLSFENITIENKTGNIGNAVRIDGASHNIRFKNVVFEGTANAATGADNAVIYSTANAAKSNIGFDGCEINNGSVGIYKGSETTDSRTAIIGTLFFNQYESAISLSNEISPILSNNVISSVSNYKNYKAISLDKIAGKMIVSSNVINAVNGTYGLAINNCAGNKESYGDVTNNSVNVGGTKSMYGLYIAGSTDNIVFNFNRVKITPTKLSAPNQAYYKNMSSGSNINLLNNIFFDLNTGGYTLVGNTYTDFFNQLPAQSNSDLNVSANGVMIEKVMPIN